MGRRTRGRERHRARHRKHQRARRRPHRPGLAPGTIVASEQAARPRISVLAYDAEHLERHDDADLDRIAALRGGGRVVWVDVVGLGDSALIERIGRAFGLHRLALEDVVNTHQRPKVDDYPDHLFFVGHIVHTDPDDGTLSPEQLSLFLGDGLVVTFQERPDDCFDAVRDRLQDASRLIRRSGADYLYYALTDAIIDHWFPLLESMSDRLELLEDEVVDDPSSRTVARIRRAKRDLLTVRRLVWPLRDAMAAMQRDTGTRFSEATRPYLRDCYDHTLRVIDLTETYRDQIGGLSDAYMSSISHRMNEVMALLTVIATIFIPLGFIAGLYGMNFDGGISPWNMPELRWRYGYPAALALMALVAFGMLAYFRWKGWIGGGRGPARDDR